jgi:hypothetical protein
MAIEKSKDEKEKTSQEEITSKAEVSKKDTPEKSEEMIPMSQVQSLIDDRLKEVASANRDVDLGTAIAEALVNAQANNETKKFDEFSYLSRAEIAKDDWLKEPVKFWALGVFLVIADDRRQGNQVPAPRGVIRFLPQGTKRKPRGKETQIQIICAYETRSKREAEWLKEHTLFGARFFLKSGDAFNIDIRYAQKVASYVQAMMNTHANQVVAQATELGLNPDDDITTLRIAVAQHRAQNDISKYQERNKEILEETSKAALLTKDMPGAKI